MIIMYSGSFSIMTIGGKEFPGGASGKEPTCQCMKCKRCRFSPWVRKIPWRRAWQPFQYSCLENPVDRGAWWATVHSIAKSQTRQKRLSRHSGRALPDPLPRSSFVNLFIYFWLGWVFTAARALHSCHVGATL